MAKARRKKQEITQGLSDKEIESFKTLLTEKREKLLASANESRGLGDNPPDKLSDEVDLASAEYEAAFENRLRDREKFLLKKINKSLQRIAEGIFDSCDSCGGYISKRRLNARPETTMCIECKEEQEKIEKMYEKKRTMSVNFEI